ncbi:MAG: tetratricopeptide repeat protein [Woeseiaceae bacterium]|nr:tetratricopeptide repeat protein [Woeseiaceae bacterium]
MGSRIGLMTAILLVSPVCWGQAKDVITRDTNPTTVIGPRNIPLYDGAQELLAGNDAEGVRLTLKGLELAQGRREEEAALSNLCAGYIKLALYDNALKYCNLLLQRNDKSWRGYNNRAVIYIQTKQWEKAERDLERGEELNPSARTLKIARSMYMDAVHPVAPAIEIDDRQRQISAENNPPQ